MQNFLLLSVHYIPLLMLFNIELFIFRGGERQAGIWGVGGAGINRSLG